MSDDLEIRDEPAWQRDFPYTTSGEEEVTRREFNRFLMGASIAAAASTGLLSIWTMLRPVNNGSPSPIIALDDLPVGSSHIFAYPSANDPAIVIRPDGDTVLGFSQRCTHLGCVVYWVPGDRRLECPCHEGAFSLEGEPVKGPPDRPLGRIDVEVRDGVVWATSARKVET